MSESSCAPCIAPIVILLFLAFVAAAPAIADTRLTGDWGGGRSWLEQRGVTLGLNYTAEPAVSVAGGYRHDATYLHNIDAAVTLDMDALIGFSNTTFLAKYSSRSGDNLSEEYVVPAETEDGRYVYGEYFNKSQEAFGGQKTKLVNFQFTSRPTADWRIDYGRLVMNDLFLRSDLYCNFMNNAICGSPKGVFTPYALSAYPDATMGVHAQYQVNALLDIKAGVFDGGWMDQNPNGWDWTLGENGMAIAAEAQVFVERAKTADARRVIKLGVNHHTGDFHNFKSAAETTGQTSLYALTDWRLYQEHADSSQGLAFFGSLVVNTDDEIAALPISWTLGLVYQGLLPTRDRDKLGLMLTHAEHSKYNLYTHNFVPGLKRDSETLLELTYNFDVGYGIQIMPSVQYINNPNGSRDFDAATVLGLKFSVNL